MMILKSASFISSAVLHSTIALFFLAPWTGGSALEMGDGEDQFIAEQGISIEGVGFGSGLVTTEAVEETPMEMSAARPEIEEVKAPEPVEDQREEPLEELPEDTEVVTSDSETALALEAEPERKEEVVKREKPQEAQVATLEQQARVAVMEERQSGAKKLGGDATKSVKTVYKSALWKKIFGRSVGGRNGLEGRVVVRITISNSGELLKSELVESSGHKKLDKLALNNVRRAAPFESLPNEMSDAPFVATVPFNFSVRKRKKRRR